MQTSHAVSLALDICTCSDSAMPLLSWLAYAITANGVCLHMLVPPLAKQRRLDTVELY